jgi:hypothetical protein
MQSLIVGSMLAFTRDLTSKLKREHAAHKITKDEMQKARNALNSVRTQAQVSPDSRPEERILLK